MAHPSDIHTYGTAPPHAHYVPAIGHAGLVFTSGQLPRLPDGTHTAERSFEEQVRLTLDNLDRVLALAGTSRNRVLHVTAFLVGIDHWDAFNRVYADFFGDWARPARFSPSPPSTSTIWSRSRQYRSRGFKFDRQPPK